LAEANGWGIVGIGVGAVVLPVEGGRMRIMAVATQVKGEGAVHERPKVKLSQPLSGEEDVYQN
jgi:hypothetical protein